MCIIMYKPEGVELPTIETLKTCFTNNPDGAGIMFYEKGKVRIEKGFMTWAKFEAFYSKLGLQRKHAFAVHFRIKTSGKTNPAMCHPFHVSSRIKDIQATASVCSNALMHNGIIGSGEKDISDTAVFVRDILSVPFVIDALKKGDEKARQFIEGYTTGSRLLLFTEKRILLTGNWESEKGVFYSNSGYKARSYYSLQYEPENVWDSFEDACCPHCYSIDIDYWSDAGTHMFCNELNCKGNKGFTLAKARKAYSETYGAAF